MFRPLGKLQIDQCFKQKCLHLNTQSTSNTILNRHVGKLSIPLEMADTIEFVTGLGSFMIPSRRKAEKFLPEQFVGDCSGSSCFVVPETIRNIYNISKENAAGDASSQQGVAEFGGNFGEVDSDLATFGKNVGAVKPLKVDKRQAIESPNTPSQPSEETTLDIQYLSALGGLNTK